MPVEIKITGADAQESIMELGTLAAALVGKTTATPQPQEGPKQRSRNTSNPSTDEKKQSEQATPTTSKQDQQVDKGTTDTEPSADNNDVTGEPDEPVPSIVDLRAKAAEIGKTPEGKAQVKALLTQLGSKSVTDLPEEKRAEFMKRLEELAA